MAVVCTTNVSMFFMGYALGSRGRTIGRVGLDPVQNNVHLLLVETCLRLVGALTPNNKRSYETTR